MVIIPTLYSYIRSLTTTSFTRALINNTARAIKPYVIETQTDDYI